MVFGQAVGRDGDGRKHDEDLPRLEPLLKVGDEDCGVREETSGPPRAEASARAAHRAAI